MEKHIEYLVKKIFDKAQQETGNASLNGCCIYLETKFRDDLKCYDGSSYKTFTRLHSKYVTKKQPENPLPKPSLLDAMSVYIGYQDFQDYLLNRGKIPIGSGRNPKAQLKTKNPERTVIVVLVFIIIGILGFRSIIGDPLQCMIWKGTQFKKISCEFDPKIYKPGKIREFDSKLFKNMRMIPKKEVKVGSSYYYKLSKDSLEFFSWYGKHPVNGDDLKPVTDYIVNKYIIGK